MPTLTMRKGDRKSDLRVTLKDRNDDPVDLTNAQSVEWQLLNPATLDSVKFGPCTIETPRTGGIVKYEFDSDDSDTRGLYRVVWVVLWATGITQTFPGGSEFTLYIW